eukprot:symbB.v1.2.006749.t1/scaffold405.1/size210896/5
MAEWQPPWIHEGIQEMNFDEEKLPEMPVKDWVGQPKQSAASGASSTSYFSEAGRWLGTSWFKKLYCCLAILQVDLFAGPPG